MHTRRFDLSRVLNRPINLFETRVFVRRNLIPMRKFNNRADFIYLFYSILFLGNRIFERIKKEHKKSAYNS